MKLSTLVLAPEKRSPTKPGKLLKSVVVLNPKNEQRQKAMLASIEQAAAQTCPSRARPELFAKPEATAE